MINVVFQLPGDGDDRTFQLAAIPRVGELVLLDDDVLRVGEVVHDPRHNGGEVVIALHGVTPATEQADD